MVSEICSGLLLEIVSAANNVAELVTRVVPTFYSAF